MAIKICSSAKRKNHFLRMLFTFFVLIFFTLSIHAQNPKEKEIYDSLTYHYSQNDQWDSVIDIGKEALYKDYDFYFLRMRMGEAYFNLRNYRLAELQYTKALEVKPADANAAFFQYQSAINGGRQDVAYHQYKSYNEAQKALILGDNKTPKNSKLPVKLKPIELISLLTSYSFTANKKNVEEFLPKESGTLYSQTNIRESQSLTTLGIKGNVSENFTWNFAYTYKFIELNNLYRQELEDPQSNKSNIKQHEFFGSLIFWQGEGTNIQIFGQHLSMSEQFKWIYIESLNFSPPEGNDSILVPNPSFKNWTSESSESSNIWGLRINKTINILDIAGFGSYSTFRSAVQLGGEITILPNGNYGLYLTNRLTYYIEHDSHKTIYKVIVGGQINQKIQFLAGATFGDLQYTNESDHGIVYNLSEKTRFKAEVGLNYSITNKLFLNLKYQLIQKEENIAHYQFDGLEAIGDHLYKPQFDGRLSPYQFNEHFVFLGLNWFL